MSLSLDLDTITLFQREWEPLNASLLPIEHLREGVFACKHLKNQNNVKPIVIWDVTKDLAEQTMIEVAENIDIYEKMRKDDEDPFETTWFERRRRQRRAEKEFLKAIEAFNLISRDFHQRYTSENQDNPASSFEHDRLNKMPRYDEWKPVRFCVHDHLMGVMGYCFNRMRGYLEVAGFATRDHTNYARSSATRSLLLSLLCEWAKQNSNKGMVFLDKCHGSSMEVTSVPHEIIVYARVLGVYVQFGTKELSHSVCKALFLQLTPFGMRTQEILEGSDLSIKACLLVHKGIWSTHQIEDLIRYCPMASSLFEGDAKPEKPVQMGMIMEHVRHAVMAGVSEQMVRNQAEEKLSSISIIDLDECLLVRPYSRLISCNCDIHLFCYENGQRFEEVITAGTYFIIYSWPATPFQFKEKIVAVLESMVTLLNLSQTMPLANKFTTICLMIPAQTIINQSLNVDVPLGIHLTLMDETLDVIGQKAWQNIQQSWRI